MHKTSLKPRNMAQNVKNNIKKVYQKGLLC